MEKKADVNTREITSQAVVLAEQLGRIAGTIEGKAETWLNRASLTDQLTRVRDGAAQLLESLAGGAEKGRQAGLTSRGVAAPKQPDLAHAPGKRHMKAAPSVRGAKKSDERIPKARAAKQMRQRRKTHV